MWRGVVGLTSLCKDLVERLLWSCGQPLKTMWDVYGIIHLSLTASLHFYLFVGKTERRFLYYNVVVYSMMLHWMY